ncbi:hypothetical protein MHYP_G00178640 [Metynnis hypsauchen]
MKRKQKLNKSSGESFRFRQIFFQKQRERSVEAAAETRGTGARQEAPTMRIGEISHRVPRPPPGKCWVSGGQQLSLMRGSW